MPWSCCTLSTPCAPPVDAPARIAAIGRLCEKCDGKCPICDSYVRPATLVRVCDECNYGSYEGRCVICGGVGISDAYYCKECTILEKDRDGCPKIVNLGSAKTDLFYERKKVRSLFRASGIRPALGCDRRPALFLFLFPETLLVCSGLESGSLTTLLCLTCTSGLWECSS